MASPPVENQHKSAPAATATTPAQNDMPETCPSKTELVTLESTGVA